MNSAQVATANWGSFRAAVGIWDPHLLRGPVLGKPQPYSFGIPPGITKRRQIAVSLARKFLSAEHLLKSEGEDRAHVGSGSP
jgi:hypothetical protein